MCQIELIQVVEAANVSPVQPSRPGPPVGLRWLDARQPRQRVPAADQAIQLEQAKELTS